MPAFAATTIDAQHHGFNGFIINRFANQSGQGIAADFTCRRIAIDNFTTGDN